MARRNPRIRVDDEFKQWAERIRDIVKEERRIKGFEISDVTRDLVPAMKLIFEDFNGRRKRR